MKDTYADFISLSSFEKEDVDFKIQIKHTDSRIAIIAPHGGCIEPGTSEIANAIADNNLSCYCFEGIKNHGNRVLHITSTNFDEPKCIEIYKNSDMVIAIHGAKGDNEIVYVGGLNEWYKYRLIENLRYDGFNAQEDRTSHSGQHISNICNKGILKQGLQLEISMVLRKKMFKGLKRWERKQTTDVFEKFIQSVRSVLLEDNYQI